MATIAGLSSLCALALAACGGFVYTTVGGTIKGLTTGSTLILVNETNYNHTTSVDGNFSFQVASNAAYNIIIYSQPNPVNCVITNGTGKMTSESPVTNVAVNCLPNVPLGGKLTNLAADKTLTLAVDGSQQSAIAANGDFTLQTYVVDKKPYVVSVAIPPASQVCLIQNGAGTANINNLPAAKNIAVNCVPGVPVGGVVSGLKTGTGLGLTNNGKDVRFLGVDGIFTFAFSLLDGEAYDVQVTTQPTGQKCTVANGTGKAEIAKPTGASNIAITCVAA